MAAVLKTADPQGFVSSNLTLSASKQARTPRTPARWLAVEVIADHHGNHHGSLTSLQRDAAERMDRVFAVAANSVIAPGPQSITHRARVIAPVEMQGPDLVEQPCGVDGVDGGLEHGDVVAVAPSLAQPTGMP